MNILRLCKLSVLIAFFIILARVASAQDEFIGKSKVDLISYCNVEKLQYEQQGEVFTINGFRRWNTTGTLQVILDSAERVASFELSIPSRSIPKIIQKQYLEQALHELKKNYGKALFFRQDEGTVIYSWDTKHGTIIFSIFTKNFLWTFGYLPNNPHP